MNKNNFDSVLIVLEVTLLKHCPWESHHDLTLGDKLEVRPNAFRRLKLVIIFVDLVLYGLVKQKRDITKCLFFQPLDTSLSRRIPFQRREDEVPDENYTTYKTLNQLTQKRNSYSINIFQNIRQKLTNTVQTNKKKIYIRSFTSCHMHGYLYSKLQIKKYLLNLLS